MGAKRASCASFSSMPSACTAVQDATYEIGQSELNGTEARAPLSMKQRRACMRKRSKLMLAFGTEHEYEYFS